MEARRSFGGRKPLADCTNTVCKYSQQPSSFVKHANPSLASPLERIVDQTTLKEKTNHVNNPDAASGTASRSLATTVRPVTRRISADLGFPGIINQAAHRENVYNSNAASGTTSWSFATKVRPVTCRMSADLSFLASAPALTRPQNSRSDGGVSEKEFDAPYSAYTVRRKASGTKRNKEAFSSSAVARLRLDLMSSSWKKIRQANENKPKPLKVALEKKRQAVNHEEDNLIHGVPQDYIKQQRAYFAEVDAFELQEEEVTSTSALD